MELKNTIEFFLKYLLILSIFLGPLFYVFGFLSPIFPETYYSWFLTSDMRADVTTYAFLCYFPLFFVSFRFQEIFSKDYMLMIGLLISGFLCIYISFAWLYIQYFIVVIIFGALSGLMTPITFRYLKRYSPFKNSVNLVSAIVTLTIWIVIELIILNSIGVEGWRTGYLISGIINICATIPFIFIKAPEVI